MNIDEIELHEELASIVEIFVGGRPSTMSNLKEVWPLLYYYQQEVVKALLDQYHYQYSILFRPTSNNSNMWCKCGTRAELEHLQFTSETDEGHEITFDHITGYTCPSCEEVFFDDVTAEYIKEQMNYLNIERMLENLPEVK